MGNVYKVFVYKVGARASTNAYSYYQCYSKKIALTAKWMMNLNPETPGEGLWSHCKPDRRK